MLRLIGKLNEGSLLRRTLLHMAVFAAGSASVLALMSVVVLSSARALLPSHGATEAGAGETTEEPDKARDAEAGSPEAAADGAGAKGGTRTVAQMRAAKRRDGALVR
ncbi:uncharacterized protein SOCEGT47_078510 [Sorangium cellulosum]|uniref:Uncharacterized protein n=1 Tax=Sorangium cellulosum TaxID=56 RepID=A0A4P2QC08_SORCE|nr:uncharacterized protein SOCEGT47_078510 [Sorangium cellulosum]